jgi:hypothetical protein
MLRWKPYALAGAAIAMLAGLAAYQTTRREQCPRGRDLAPAEDDAVAAITAIRARTSRKRQVVGEVVAGRLSLLEAAAVFRRLDAEGPMPPPTPAGFPQYTSEDEAYCHSVVEYVEVEAPPDLKQELTRRFREEWEARLHDGTLHLPKP